MTDRRAEYEAIVSDIAELAALGAEIRMAAIDVRPTDLKALQDWIDDALRDHFPPPE